MCQVRAEILRELGEIVRGGLAVAGVRREEAAVLGLEHVVGVGEAVRGQQRAEGAGAGRLSREQPLAHAAVVREHQARRLLAGVPERVHDVLRR